jgi:hypothetical protein
MTEQAPLSFPLIPDNSTAALAKMSTELIEDIQKEYKNIQDEIYEIQQRIASKTTKLYMQVIAFFVTVSILMIIIIITTTDVLNVIKKYFDKSKNISDKEKVYLPKDDNKYEESSFSRNNELNSAEQTIFNQLRAQQSAMRNTIDWKKKNAVTDADKVDAQVDLRVLEPAYDDYTYSPQKQGMNFWKMLFMPPNYHKLIDSKGSPYYRFQNE